MDFRTAQRIADDPTAYPLTERSAAFSWAHRKAGDRRVSQAYRDQCHAIAKAIWAAVKPGKAFEVVEQICAAT